MASFKDPFSALKSLNNDGKNFYYSLPTLQEKGLPISRLPVSIRIVLESLLRHCDGQRVREDAVIRLAKWNAKAPEPLEVPFIVARVILQDFTGVPLLVDLAAMRDAVALQGKNPSLVEPQVPVDLVVDHSVQVDRSGTSDAYISNLQIELDRNRERYSFLKWGQQAFKTFKVVPPGIGIVHQVNLEHLATLVTATQYKEGMLLYFDTLVGTDSHTTMINGLGVVGWGVGGIEAEAAMLGQPVFIQTPEVIGVHMSGKLNEGVTATDLTLRVTELLRKEKVVDKFIEFFGEGAASLTVADRATIGNMAPEYGATMGFFPPDEASLEYMLLTGRDPQHIKMVRDYLIAQQMFGIPRKGEVDYTKTLELDLSSIVPSVAGPKRPQDRIELSQLKGKFSETLKAATSANGYAKEDRPRICVHAGGNFSLTAKHETGGIETLKEEKGVEPSWSEAEMVTNRPITTAVVPPGYSEHIHSDESVCDIILGHGSVAIAAITSCTNTSNPSVMIAAGLLAKKAVEKGLRVNSMVKTSLAPGSRVVTDYLEKSDLQKYLDQLGFNLVAYGCTTCIGNSGPLDEKIESAIKDHDLVVASVLSGNRNFEARIHSAVKANFLMSPPLVVAFAIAGRIDIDMEKDPLGYDKEGNKVFLKDIWPSTREIQDSITASLHPAMFKKRYAHVQDDNPLWSGVEAHTGTTYSWEPKSTYIQKPPYFEGFSQSLPSRQKLDQMRALAIFGDSVTTDHISPAGAFKANSAAGKYLIAMGVKEEDFNSYGSRRGNDRVMVRGTFGNVRIRNHMAEGKEGSYTKLYPEGTVMTIYDACQSYAQKKTPLIIFAGKDYGMGSSRDWAAKGTALLGVKAVIAKSFERIHRSNLIGMGVLPLEFIEDESVESLGIKGDETFSLEGVEKGLKTKQKVTLHIHSNGTSKKVTVIARLDTGIEVEYYEHGGILPYVLRHILKK